MFADDATFFNSVSKQSFEKLRDVDVITNYEHISGLKLNVNKT
jgi:hypothetical protein